MEPVPIIHNPASGGGRGRVRFREAEAILAVKGVEVEPHQTERPGHATTLARQLAEAGHKTIYVFGGDGTFSEAANGVRELPRAKRPTFGILPSGTGNDFLRDFGVTDLHEAIRRITAGRARPVDTARYTDPSGVPRWSINVFGTGFAAEAADLTNRRLKWVGRQAYNVAVLAKLASLSPTPTHLRIDDEELDGDYPLVMVCNTIHTGGAMRMAPDARTDDGLLDVLTLEGVGRRELMGLLLKLRDGTHVHHPKVTVRRAKRIHIEPERNGPLLVDGEVTGTTPVDVEVEKHALRVLL